MNNSRTKLLINRYKELLHQSETYTKELRQGMDPETFRETSNDLYGVNSQLLQTAQELQDLQDTLLTNARKMLNGVQSSITSGTAKRYEDLDKGLTDKHYGGKRTKRYRKRRR